jgi:3D (Asp-Asp-Asp) domain-containing protein
VKCCGKTDGITSTGTEATQGRTIAVDPKKIPYGTEVEIEGVGVRVAEDCGGAIKGNRIDLYFDSHQEALNFGRQTLQVKIFK